MTQFTLTLLDTSGIQPYIFGSNRLQENIGASEIVYRATTLWVFRALDEMGIRHNVRKWENVDWDLDNSNCFIEDPGSRAQIVYAGGGNTMILFRSEPEAHAFVGVLTRRLLRDAPGLTLHASHTGMDWQFDRLDNKRDELLKSMAEHKQSRLPSTPLLGLGVTAVCESTGLVASCSNKGKIRAEGRNVSLCLREEEEERLISRETASKLGWRDLANERLTKQVGESLPEGLRFPLEIDKLGRVKGEESYVAVIHADGNNMGDHIAKIGQEIDWQDIGRGNGKFIEQMASFSRAVDKASLAALREVVRKLGEGCSRDEDEQAETEWFPFRPLVFGGDDVTFLCNAPLALAATAEYLKEFEREAQSRELVGMHACAGVAMVKTHYPFARACALSHQLCASAKGFLKQEIGEDLSAFDWHFATGGLSGSLGEIRRREYEVPHGRLYMRPVLLSAMSNDQTGRYWEDGIERLVREFQSGKEWEQRRNKVKGLQSVLRAGPIAVKAYCRDFRLPDLPALIPGATSYRQNGWMGDRCIYFDAIELMDHAVTL